MSTLSDRLWEWGEARRQRKFEKEIGLPAQPHETRCTFTWINGLGNRVRCDRASTRHPKVHWYVPTRSFVDVDSEDDPMLARIEGRWLTAEESRGDTMTALIDPDCRDGKHRACPGDTYNPDTDTFEPCQCHCHQEATP